MNINDLIKLAQGKPIAVECGKRIEDLEDYPEPGMRMMVLGGTVDNQDIARVAVDFEPFDAHNRAFESANYYDSDRVPRLTAREKGSYKPKTNLHFMATDELQGWLTVLENETTALAVEYLAQPEPRPSYVAWLEQQLLQARRT
jgi:hypothetical protein